MRSNIAPGVPLAHYRQHGAGVRLFCLDCLAHRDLPLEPVLERLKARGFGDERTGIKAVAGFVCRPCPNCGGAGAVSPTTTCLQLGAVSPTQAGSSP